eukprot:363121-Chlamydomonas_euryale.AAC.5
MGQQAARRGAEGAGSMPHSRSTGCDALQGRLACGQLTCARPISMKLQYMPAYRACPILRTMLPPEHALSSRPCPILLCLLQLLPLQKSGGLRIRLQARPWLSPMPGPLRPHRDSSIHT